MSHRQIALLWDPEATMMESGEMETEQGRWVSLRNVLMIPPVWISQSFTVLSLLPDASSVPSDEKARDVTPSACPEKPDMRVPVIVSRAMMSPELSPTATMSLWHARASGKWSKETTREHVPHLSGRPLTTSTVCRDSAVYHLWSEDEEGENGTASW